IGSGIISRMDLSTPPATGPRLRREIPAPPLSGRFAMRITITLRTSKAAKHMTKDLEYLLRYAPLSEQNGQARERTVDALAWARQRIAARQSGIPRHWFDGFDQAPSITLSYDAEHRSVATFIELLPECDKIYWALGSQAAHDAFETPLLRSQCADVYRILRSYVVQIGGGPPDQRIR
ncbi:MAG: hypothetical protein ACKO15_01025, partial [Burkholderiales bacterium]